MGLDYSDSGIAWLQQVLEPSLTMKLSDLLSVRLSNAVRVPNTVQYKRHCESCLLTSAGGSLASRALKLA